MTLEELKNLIRDVTGKEVSSLVEQQIIKLCQDGYTYKEIGRCVWYFFKILNNDISKIDQYGIGIVRNIRNSANKYYEDLKIKQEKQKAAAERVKDQQIKSVEIKPYRRTFNKKEVNIDGL